MFKVAIALGSAIVFASLGDILLSRGMQANGEVHLNTFQDVTSTAKSVFTRPQVILGIVSMAAYFASYIAALAWIDVSVANPLTALSYLVATVYAACVLREPICTMRWFGVALVIVGAVFVGISS